MSKILNLNSTIKKKIKILRIISTLNPESGGPQASIIKSSNSLVDGGFEVDVLVSDKKNYINNKKNKFNIIKLGIENRSYNFSFKIIDWIKKNKKKYDFFIIEGIWEFNSLLARLYIKKNYFIITHGQLDPYFAENIFKRLKKQVYWALFEKKNLINSNGILVSGSNEIKMIKNTFVNTKGIKVHNVGYSYNLNIINDEKKNYKKIFDNKFPKLKKMKFILFLGRIHHKKGCDILLDAILRVKDLNNYKFLIVGFSNRLNKYENYILKKINSNKRLYTSVFTSKFVSNDLKVACLKMCEATILPSRGENFGVSVTETLSVGKIPLITNKVGIFNEIKKYNSGIICNDNHLSVAIMIKKFINFKKKTLMKYKKNSKRCFKDIFDINVENNKLIKIIKVSAVQN